jgi:hypothetical protein
MKMQRYAYVGPKREDAKIHLTTCGTYWIEGAYTKCSLLTAPGWGYWVGARNVPKNRAICARCRP